MSSFYDALLRRELRLRSLFFCQVLQAVLYSAVAIALAVAGAGVWSLVVGQLVGSAGFLVAAVASSPLRISPRWHSGTAGSFWQTGKGFVLHSALWFASSNADYIVVGRFSGAAGLGAYSMAYRLIELPSAAVADPVAQVSFPSFARMRHGRLDVRGPYLRLLSLVALTACPLGILLSATADPFVSTVLGAGWERAVDPLAILGLWGALLPLSTTGAWLLNSVGQQMTTAKIHGSTLILFIGPLIAAAALGGLTAVAAVMLARGLLTCVLVLAATRRRASIGLREHVGVLRGVGPGCVVAWLSAYGLAAALAGAPALVALVASAAIGLAAYLALVTALDRPLLTLARSQLQAALTRGLAQPAAGSGTA